MMDVFCLYSFKKLFYDIFHNSILTMFIFSFIFVLHLIIYNNRERVSILTLHYIILPSLSIIFIFSSSMFSQCHQSSRNSSINNIILINSSSLCSVGIIDGIENITVPVDEVVEEDDIVLMFPYFFS